MLLESVNTYQNMSKSRRASKRVNMCQHSVNKVFTEVTNTCRNVSTNNSRTHVSYQNVQKIRFLKLFLTLTLSSRAVIQSAASAASVQGGCASSRLDRGLKFYVIRGGCSSALAADLFTDSRTALHHGLPVLVYVFHSVSYFSSTFGSSKRLC